MEINGSAIKEISKVLKTPYILIAIALGSGMILFLPDSIIDKMYMKEFRDKSGFILGLLFLFCMTLLIVMFGVRIIKKYSKRIQNNRIKRGMKKYLSNMNSKAEIEIIKQMLKEDDYTLELPINSGAVIKLTYNCIISPTSNTYYVEFENPHIPYFLQPGVITIIEENEDLQKKFNYNR